jgi:membrane protein
MQASPAAGSMEKNKPRIWPAAVMALLVLAGFGPKRQAAMVESGADASPTRSSRPSLWRIVYREVRDAIVRDRVLAIAAGVTFYTLLAVFPAIAALVALYGLFADPTTISKHLSDLSGLLPGGAIDVVRNEISRITAQSRGELGITFFAGLLVSLWSASGGARALIEALNVVYGAEEKRGFVKRVAISLVFVAGAALFMLLAIAAVIALPIMVNVLSLSGYARWVTLLEWPLMLVIVAVALGLVYRYGPCFHHRPSAWRWISWGSAIAAVAWIAASIAFSWYAANFGSFNKTYGSLGAVMGFMTWIWISAIVVLLGGQIDAVLERSRSPRPQTERRASR